MKHINNIERKRIYLIILFVLGLIIGIPGTVLLSSNKTFREQCWAYTGMEVKRFVLPHMNIVQLLMYILISLVGMLAVTLIIRFFRSSKSLPFANHVVRLLVCIGVGFPFTLFLFVKADHYVQQFDADTITHLLLNIVTVLIFLALFDKKGVLGRFIWTVILVAAEVFVVRHFHFGNEVKSIRGSLIMELRFAILVLLFAAIFCYATALLGDMCYEILKYPSRRCRLEVLQVMDRDHYESSRMVTKRKKFEKCFQTMKLNKDSLLPTQFFRITEMGPLGLWKAQHWNYYGNGEIMRLREEEICPVLWKNVQDAVGGADIKQPDHLFSDDGGMGPGFG